MADDRWSAAARSLSFAVVVLVLAVVAALVVRELVADDPVGDAGRLTENAPRWSGDADPPLPVFADATNAWGLTGLAVPGDDELRGGVAIVDIDGDGRNDLINGGDILFNDGLDGTGGGFVGAAGSVGIEPVVSVGYGDLDRDGLVDLLFGAAEGDDIIVWGGPWTTTRDLAEADRSTIAGGSPTTGLMVAQLDGDDRLDLLRLGYNTADVIYHQVDARLFEPTELPGTADRLSLAGEIADIDGDGLVDIWITRDVGWQVGPDSVFSRSEPGGSWVDIAPAVGADLAVDGMGVTVADLNDDERLDAYVSDLGDNEVLLARADDAGFDAVTDTGAARIRPIGAGESEVSSSWASGAADLNLDGVLDLVVVNGGFIVDGMVNKIEGTTVVTSDPPGLLLGRGDGTFVDVWPELGLGWSGRSRGLAIGDLDGDGGADLVITNVVSGVTVLRNNTQGRSVTVGFAPACLAAGNRMRLESGLGRMTTVGVAHGFLSTHAPELVVGIPDDGGEVRAEVEWTGVGSDRPTMRARPADELGRDFSGWRHLPCES